MQCLKYPLIKTKSIYSPPLDDSANRDLEHLITAIVVPPTEYEVKIFPLNAC